MGTLVLTVVGGIVGGPVGAALGAAIGQQADAAIFKPKGREGPRLADLKVQASTYGQQIPRLFGTMRVAGSVIWATDLIERRTIRTITDPVFGTYQIPGMPLRFSEFPEELPLQAEYLGQSNVEIFTKYAGASEAEIGPHMLGR